MEHGGPARLLSSAILLGLAYAAARAQAGAAERAGEVENSSRAMPADHRAAVTEVLPRQSPEFATRANRVAVLTPPGPGLSATVVEARGFRRAMREDGHRATREGVGAGGPRIRERWFQRVSRTQSEQPHWITPLVTVTPRLEEEYRFDMFRQAQPAGGTVKVYGGGKGLELIPAERVELILGVPPYIVHDPPGALDGLGDTSFLLKYRVLAANEEKGNYIFTLFLGASAPTAFRGNGPGRAIFTPTLAFGKGWGRFDVQSTLGVGLPAGAIDRLGSPFTHNTAFQYRVLNKLWPEFEVNSTWWPNGRNHGRKQIFLTPGLVVGRLPIWKRLGLTVGAGVQIAVTRFRTFDHNWILSVRLPF